MNSVLVVGAGAWGTALALHLAHAGRRVTLWARDPAPILADRCSPRLPGHRLPDHLAVTGRLDAAPFDAGPLAAGLMPYRLDELELGERSRYERRFNWKVLLENYCENYHTPFIHSQLPTGGYEYPIEVGGPAVIAWDRPLEPLGRSQQALHDHRAEVGEVAEQHLGRRGARRGRRREGSGTRSG